MAQMGRPRTFDRDAALTSAMHLFWEHGYESTSLAQLKSAMGGGISAPSFYAAFGSKEALYREALARYMDTHGTVTRCLHDTALPPRRRIELALRRSARMQCDTDHPKGCMVALGVMSAVSAGNEAIAQLLQDTRKRTRRGVRSCVEDGIASGELLPTTDVASLVASFDGFLLGMSVLVRDGVRHAVLATAITKTMGLWDAEAAAPPRPVLSPG